MSLTDTPPADRRSILLGIPDSKQRQVAAELLRSEGHLVAEAANAGEMKKYIDEIGDRRWDAIVCAGLLSEQEDPDLAARLRQPSLARALVLLPAGGLLSTASRAQRLRASAVLPDVAGLRSLLADGDGGAG